MKLFKASFNILITIAVLLLVPSCSSTQQISGNGHMKSDTRQVSNFTRMECAGNFHVFLTQGNNTSLKIEADKNLLPYIISDIHGDKFLLKTKEDVVLKPTHSINVYLTMKTIKMLNISHLCILQSKNTIHTNNLELSVSGVARMDLKLKAESLKARISGRGKMNIKGKATAAKYHISGSADVMAGSFATDNTKAHISGSGRLHVNVQKKLNASISGNGKLWYNGNPQIEELISGTGKIIRE